MAAIEVRPVELADRPAVNALIREHRFKSRSEDGWRWLYARPARCGAGAPMGWVLDGGGTLLGYLANHAQDYLYGGRDLASATCSNLYVHPTARAQSTALFRTWLRQRGFDLFMSTSANENSRGMYELFGARAPTDASFAEGYAWPADERDLLDQLLGPARPLAPLLAPAARPARLAFRPRKTRFRGEVAVLAPHEIGAEFDHLGERLRADGALQVRRDAAVLRWYTEDPDALGDAFLVGGFDRAGLAGYALARPHRAPQRRVSELRLVDLVFRPGAQDVVGPLLTRLVRKARESGAGLVYCGPVGAQLVPVLRSHRPYIHRIPHARHFVRAARQGLQAELDKPGAWHATGLDGDSGFAVG